MKCKTQCFKLEPTLKHSARESQVLSARRTAPNVRTSTCKRMRANECECRHNVWPHGTLRVCNLARRILKHDAMQPTTCRTTYRTCDRPFFFGRTFDTR